MKWTVDKRSDDDINAFCPYVMVNGHIQTGRKMRNFTAVAAFTYAALGVANCALAADLPTGNVSPAFITPVPVFVWTGPYVGMNTGYAFGTASYSYAVKPEGSPFVSGVETKNAEGVIGGGQIGYNFSLGGVVVGAEADLDATSIAAQGILYGLLRTRNTVSVGSDTNYIGTARGRLGYGFGRLLVYGTGGFAYGNVTSSADAPNIAFATRVSHDHTGYAFGGGLEYAITDHISIRAEYLRINLGTKFFVNNNDPNLSYTASEHPIYNIARVGINYQFGLFAPVAAPVVARY